MMFARARHPGVLCSCSNVELVHADTGVCIDPGAAEGGAARGTSGGDDKQMLFNITPVSRRELLELNSRSDVFHCVSANNVNKENTQPTYQQVEKRLGESLWLSMK